MHVGRGLYRGVPPGSVDILMERARESIIFRLAIIGLGMMMTFNWLVHYEKMLDIYARMGAHITQPILYVSIETWLLSCIVALFVLAYLAVRLLETQIPSVSQTSERSPTE